jgi:hypothetical protein
MGGLAHDTPEMDGTGEFRVERSRDIVLAQLACAPARYIKETVIEGQIDIGDQRRYGAKVLQERR